MGLEGLRGKSIVKLSVWSLTGTVRIAIKTCARMITLGDSESRCCGPGNIRKGARKPLSVGEKMLWAMGHVWWHPKHGSFSHCGLFIVTSRMSILLVFLVLVVEMIFWERYRLIRHLYSQIQTLPLFRQKSSFRPSLLSPRLSSPNYEYLWYPDEAVVVDWSRIAKQLPGVGFDVVYTLALLSHRWNSSIYQALGEQNQNNCQVLASTSSIRWHCWVIGETH